MPKYRKKPVVIEAVRIPYATVPNWLSAALAKGDVWSDGNKGLRIKTLEGVMHASPGDYIIQGVKGEIYPCKPDIFDATYELAE